MVVQKRWEATGGSVGDLRGNNTQECWEATGGRF